MSMLKFTGQRVIPLVTTDLHEDTFSANTMTPDRRVRRRPAGPDRRGRRRLARRPAGLDGRG